MPREMNVPLQNNLLLRAIGPTRSEALNGQPRQVMLGEVLYDGSDATERVFFPIDSVISLVRELQDGSSVEVGIVGAEGLTGLGAIFGVRSTAHRALVQSRGYLLEVASETMREAIRRDPAVSEVLNRYVYTFIGQLSQLAACNRRHEVIERLAHWLLLMRDRVGSDEMGMTHEFLSRMLGARRASISVAMNMLKLQGCIRTERKRVIIIDRLKLESKSCECYRASVNEYQEALGFPPIAPGRLVPVT